MAQPMPFRSMTLEDLDALPDDGYHYELRAGLLISEPTPGFRHGRVASRIAEILGSHARRNRLGTVVTNDSGFILSRSPDTVLGPDVSFVSRERLERIGDPVKAFPGAPDLAVEVKSPSNTPADTYAKVADYLAAGTRVVWVVDPETKCIAVYRELLSPRTVRCGEVISIEDLLPGLTVSVSEVFEL